MIITKLTVISLLLLGVSVGQAQSVSQQLQSTEQYYTPAPQSYVKPHPQKHQQVLDMRSPANNKPIKNTYDPLSGVRQGQNRPGGFWEGVKHDINPCGKSYGVVLDGWHDMGLLMTIRSGEWWAAALFFILLIIVGFDDLFRKWRANDVREAMAGASLIFMNDRAHAIRLCNDAVYKHNILVLNGDAAATKGDIQSRIEISEAARQAPALLASSANSQKEKEEEQNNAPQVEIIKPENGSAPMSNSDREEETSAAEEAANGENDEAANADMVKYSVNGASYRIPRSLQLHILAIERKVASLRLQNQKLKEQIAQYEKN
jgi:hypothetical protein